MNKMQENIIEIAWWDQILLTQKRYKEGIDSMERKTTIIYLAEKFEKKYGNTDWNDGFMDYYVTIGNFSVRELLDVFGKET